MDPDFLATHEKMSGNGVDIHSQRTYYLSQIRMQIGETSTSGKQDVDRLAKLGLWLDVASGNSRDQEVYNTENLSANLCLDVISLTQES
ncbi:hypothetical protein AAZX31_10G088500 [Glycine max]|nr:hypothetical protein GLYMA_10G094351v4 [Glycine max]KAH1137489.1 hypothetical protein GYH30_027473 [Glycine max]